MQIKRVERVSKVQNHAAGKQRCFNGRVASEEGSASSSFPAGASLPHVATQSRAAGLHMFQKAAGLQKPNLENDGLCGWQLAIV